MGSQKECPLGPTKDKIDTGKRSQSVQERVWDQVGDRIVRIRVRTLLKS